MKRVALLALAIGALSWTNPSAADARTTPALSQLVGQKLMVAMSGTTPSADLLGRIRRGEVGGVILFGSNITSAAQVRALTGALDGAAAAGGQPPLLIATDQEGGSVQRLKWAPPSLSPPRMGAVGSAPLASSQGRAAATALRCAGINTDLAPVGDVPSSTSSFMYQQGRTWSFDAPVTATLSDAFASGLVLGGAVASMKHFPGIGRATSNTDLHVVTITSSKSTLASGLLPYRKAIASGIPMIMLSNAVYTAYDSANAAGWSAAIGTRLLRGTLGFDGVTITDSLTGAAAARDVSATSLAAKAAQAGTDIVLVTGSESSTKATYAALLKQAEAGTISRATLQASYQRIMTLKSAMRPRSTDSAAPRVGAPVSRLVAGSTLGATTAPVTTSWTVTDSCGVSSETVARRDGDDSWTAEPLGSPSARAVTQSLAFGTGSRYRTKVIDGAGNASAWVDGTAVAPYVRQSSSNLVTLTGAWSAESADGYSGGGTRYSTNAGAAATYTFTGTGIGWVTAVGPTRGSAQVYVDGVDKGTVNLHSTTTSLRRIALAANWPIEGQHVIKIVVLGTPGHARVDVDAFVRLSEP